MTRELIERREGQGTGYTVMAKRIDPDEHPAMDRVGYGSPTTIFTVWTDGGDAVTSHDPYEILRELTGDDDWLLDDLHAMDDALQAADDVGDAPDVIMDLARYYYDLHRDAYDAAGDSQTEGGQVALDLKANAYDDAARAARQTAQFLRGERDDPPAAVRKGRAMKSDDGGPNDD